MPPQLARSSTTLAEDSGYTKASRGNTVRYTYNTAHIETYDVRL
jgi:hypothetical protein